MSKASADKRCIRCGDELPESTTFCVACGHSNDAMLGHKLVAIDNGLRWWDSIGGCMAGLFRFVWYLRVFFRG